MLGGRGGGDQAQKSDLQNAICFLLDNRDTIGLNCTVNHLVEADRASDALALQFRQTVLIKKESIPFDNRC